LIGHRGDDTYILDDLYDDAREWEDEGIDTVISSVSHSLSQNIENLVLTGSAYYGGGNDLNNLIIGNAFDNNLQGRLGNDTLIGGAGNDEYWIEQEGDLVVESADEGIDRVLSNISYTLGDNVENLSLRGPSDAIFAIGNGLDNELNGNTNANFIDGGAGNDTMSGSGGDDIFIVDSAGDTVLEWVDDGNDTVLSSVSYVLGDNVENLTLTGTASIDATGNGLTNILIGNDADNVFRGGGGVDHMYGGKGDDTYVIDEEQQNIVELEDEGTDTVVSSISYGLGGGSIENLVLTGHAYNATGNAWNNRLTGTASDNYLDGHLGADTMIGGDGNDTYEVEQAGDVVVELAGQGIDQVLSTLSYTLGDNVENLSLRPGDGAFYGTGNALDNVIVGNALDNILDGSAGNDTLIGGLGNDTYVVDQVGDVVTESGGGGDSDTVKSSISYTLGLNVENLVLTGLAAINATGNALANQLQGNAAANVLDGGAGADTMAGGAGDDTYTVDSTGDTLVELDGEGTDTVITNLTHTLATNIENLVLGGSAAVNGFGNAGNNRLVGNAAVNRLEGGAGNDTLDGGAGRDTLIGGTGDDTYLVDSTTDVVTEVAGQGTDAVVSSVTWTLGTALENLTLTGSANLGGSGNAGDNVLIGNSGNNALNGLAGADWLDGGAGADTMTGGSGNDTYVVDNVGDSVVETAGNGSDTVRASISYTLGTSQEDLILTGSANLNGTGNTQVNLLVGNSGNNVLDGGADKDTMQGGLGDDTYLVDNAGDVVIEAAGEGVDTVITSVNLTLSANVENLTASGTANRNLTGNELANVLTGNAGANTLDGAAGADTLIGGAGNDTLIGGAGNDSLVGGTGADQYRFARGDGIDTIQENDSASGTRDRIVFGAGILQGNVSFQRSGDDLWATLSGSSDRLVIQNWYGGSRYHVEDFQFADGSVRTDAQVQALVSTMAAFSAPAAVTTGGTPPDRTTQLDLAVGSTL
jgi:Ca2+-binding RTX toxin-like protein